MLFERYVRLSRAFSIELMPCAQVLEETGYDLEDQFPAAQLFPGYEEREGATRTPYYVELIIKEQKIRLYFIPGVMENSYFETRTRKEISVSSHVGSWHPSLTDASTGEQKIDWFNLDDLPMYGNQKKGKKVETMPEKNPKFYMVTPFMSCVHSGISTTHADDGYSPKASQAVDPTQQAQGSCSTTSSLSSTACTVSPRPRIPSPPRSIDTGSSIRGAGATRRCRAGRRGSGRNESVDVL